MRTRASCHVSHKGYTLVTVKQKPKRLCAFLFQQLPMLVTTYTKWTWCLACARKHLWQPGIDSETRRIEYGVMRMVMDGSVKHVHLISEGHCTSTQNIQTHNIIQCRLEDQSVPKPCKLHNDL